MCSKKASINLQLTRPSWNNLGMKENSRQKVKNLRGQKVSNQQDVGQKCRKAACMGTTLKTPVAHQKVSIKVRMMSVESPGRKSSKLTTPEARSPRADSKLEKPCIPDAQHFFQRSIFISHSSISRLETSRCTFAVKDFNNYD
jgi:hypothetical protein